MQSIYTFISLICAKFLRVVAGERLRYAFMEIR